MPMRTHRPRTSTLRASAERRSRRPLAAITTAMSLIVGLLVSAAPLPAAAASPATATAVGAVAQSLSGPQVQGMLAKLAAGNPGVPSAPTTLFQENFENVAGTAPVLLSAYTGTTGQQYSASAPWLQNCNGLIVNFNVSNALLGNCATTASASSIRQLSYALGVHAGSATPGANDAVSALTESPGPGANLIEFATLTPVPVSGANGRFLTFSLDAATRSCATSAPLYTLSYVSTGGTVTPLGSQINPCASGTGVAVPANGSLGATTLNVGSYTANGSFLSDGTAVGIRLVNANGASAGNDAAIDNVRILDVTPQLDKAFAVSARLVGQPTTLTFTITNTSELAAKSGWGFVDTLPAGMTVASTPNLGGTCTATRTAAAGSGTITVSGGSLAANQTSCTITVDVVSTQVGSYTNGPTNVTTTGLNAPGSTTVQYTNPVEWTCSPDGYLFQSIGTTTAIFAVDLVTGAYAQTGTISRPSNAQGYNTTDDYVYAVIQQRVHRVGSDGSTNDVTPMTGWVPGLYNIGDFDEAGHYWVSRNVAGSPWFEIDYAAGSPTYGQVISSGTLSPANISVGSDWVYVDGSLYSINDQGRLIVFDTATKLLTDRGPVAGVPGSVTGSPANYGAGYADADGNLYFSRNETGVIYRVDPDALTSVPFTDGPASTGNDGARCATVPVEIDLGDAPDSYGTTIGADGARHSLSAVDAGGEVALRLGSAIDAELEGQPTAEADGDDLAGIADEDGVAGPIVMASGSTTAVTVSVTNDTGTAATLAGWIDLNGNGVFDAAELVRVVVPANSGTADYTLTFPVGTATADTFARFRLFEGDVAAPSPVGPAAGGEVEDYPVTYTDRSLSVEKTSSQTADSRPGDVVTYTVTATNTGASPYDAQVPAVIFDDIRAVLDDAEYNGDASASTGPDPVYLDPGFLSWRGSLAPGASVTIEYSVTLTAGGDGVVRNVAWQPATPPEPGDPPTEVPTCDPATADGVDPVTGEPCAATSNLLPRLTVAKSADTADLPADGGAVTYTIIVTNVGPGAFTPTAPATLTDDLSEVLDDADYNGDATASVGSVTVASSQLNWSGALASGESATITYSVTYDASAGDNVLLNTACVPEDDALDPDETCAYVQIPGAALVMTKTVDPADGSVLVAGQQVTYTLSFENVGQSAATVDALDTLTGVLDDAQITAGPTASAGLTATLAGDELSITGSVPAGQTLTVTYTVTVDAFADQGDHVLGNVLSNGDGSCPPAGCEETENPIRHYTVEKEAATAAPTNPGDTVTYTVTLANDGAAPYTSTTPASISDDLAAVLDDATLTGTPTAVVVGQPGIQLPAPVFSTPTLTWSGAVGVGQTVEITYTVQVNDPRTGDGSLENTVTPTGIGGECEVDGCATITPVQWFTVSKSASATSALPGDTLVYSVVVTNDSAVPYTVAAPASFTDDLSGVLDDAAYNGDATNGATVTGSTLSWQGALAPGASVVIVYSVTVDAPPAGDAILANVVVPTGEGGECVPDECTTATPVQSYTVAKTVSAATAVPGDVLTYTVTVTNTGAVDYTADAPASFTDDLSAVLDDATYNGDATNGATVTGTTLTWSGALAVGASVDITYSVTVDDPSDGDDVLTNVVVATADGGDCEPDACTTTTELRSYTVVKTASVATAAPGDVVSYTVTVQNTGAVDYTIADPASFSDDLSAVLDDATYNDDATNGATVTGTTLTWSGALPAGDTVEIVYSVTVNDPPTGDDVLTNAVVPTGDGGACVDDCSTTTEVRSYTVAKSASTAVAEPGSVVSYTVTVTNTGAVDYTADAPASFSDDLSAVLDDATYNDDATNGATVTGTTLSWSGTLAVGVSVDITYSVTVDDPSAGDDVLTNVVTPTGDGGDCVPDACVTTTPVQSYTVSKVASTATAVPGATVGYTVTVTNTGSVDYTADAPASFTDDLSAVLDDATYNGDATGGATFAAPVLSWSGALPAGGSVEITYSVTVNDPASGDDELVNTVVATGQGGDCDPLGSCSTTTDVQSYTVSKTASAPSVQLGGTLVYTVTVTNTGGVDYTADAPASFTDDLSAVLDDATYNGDATNGATVSGSTLTWAGALAAGASIDITYSVTVNAPNTGDDVLANAVVPSSPGGSCEIDGDCETLTPVQSFSVTKTADASTVVAGDTITYTLTIVNTGAAAYTADSPATLTDDLTDVLDDATYNGDATNGAVYTAPQLSWTGALAVGETVTVTYSVTVDDPITGDRRIDNAVVTDNGGTCDDGSTDPACVVNIPAGSFTVAKTASATSALPGDVVTYTVTVRNTGAVAYTDDAPASFEDNLANVLDDATYNDDATNGATVTGTTLAWQGALAVGETIVITYSVTVDDAGSGAGDANLGNVVVASSPGGECDPEGVCVTDTPIGRFLVTKTSDGAGVVHEGDVLTYSVTVTNDGDVAFTLSDPASFTDDLSEVLDDATYNGDATAGATIDGTTLSWQGPLAVGASVTLTYSVTVGAAGDGDGVLTNAVVPGDGGACILSCSTTDELQAYMVSKTSSAGGSVGEGDVVTYTVTLTNTGAVDYTEDSPATFTDDLSAVLDDAEYNDDASAGATVSGSTLSWSGAVPSGSSIEITYSVTALAAGTGDGVFTNVVVPIGPGGECAPDDDCSTTDLLRAFRVDKATSTTSAERGDVVVYTVTVTNTGAAAFTPDTPATVTDDLSGVLDDASYNGDASNGATYAAPVLSWSLALAAGESVALTYSVTVDDTLDGDLALVNAVDPGADGACADDGACVTETPVGGFSVAKAVDVATTGPGSTVTYAITVRNEGAVAYTAENPAVFADDLSDVLDDGTYNGDATNGATYDEPVLVWSGPLAVDESITITYSVTVDDNLTGDRRLENAVLPGPGGGCAAQCSVTTSVVAPGSSWLATTGLPAGLLGGVLGAAGLAVLAGLVLLLARRPRHGGVHHDV